MKVWALNVGIASLSPHSIGQRGSIVCPDSEKEKCQKIVTIFIFTTDI